MSFAVPFNKSRFIFLLSLLVLVAACGHKQKKAGPAGFADDSFSDTLQLLLKPADTTGGADKIMSVVNSVRYTYQLAGYQPIWIKENYKPNASAAKLVAELEDMRWDGYNPEQYNLAFIKKLKEKLDTTKQNSLRDAMAFDTALTHSYLAAAKDLLIGQIIPRKVDSLWFHANDSSWAAVQMLVDANGTYHALAGYRSTVPGYLLMREEYKRYTELAADSTLAQSISSVHYTKNPDSAMKDAMSAVIRKEIPWLETPENDSVTEEQQLFSGYQFYAGIQVTGKADSNTMAHLAMPIDTFLIKLRANMERVRWMQKDFGDLYLVVDIPLMELFLRKEGKDLMHMRVVVGKPERQTPSLYAKMANIVINPAWGVPPTILKNDVLPGLEKSGKKYMKKKGLRAYDRDGNVVDPSFINESNYRRYTYKQAPGDDNALGYVKFNLPNKWDIYLHDTPHRDDFTKRNRFLSSGCIRLQHPKEMAIFILSELEKRRYTDGKLDTMIKTHKTRWEVLKNKIPVHITYLTAFEDTTGKHIRFVRDIYHRDDKLISVMN